MANIDTVKSITANLKTVLQSQGIKFDTKIYDDYESIPSGKLPLGGIIYEGENFEYNHGQRAGYAEIQFLINVIVSETNNEIMTRKMQEWVHKIRSALTVIALNIGDLASSKLVSRVVTIDEGVDVEAKTTTISLLSYPIDVRYREV